MIHALVVVLYVFSESFESRSEFSENGDHEILPGDLSAYLVAASALLDVYVRKHADENRLFIDEFKVRSLIPLLCQRIQHFGKH